MPKLNLADDADVFSTQQKHARKGTSPRHLPTIVDELEELTLNRDSIIFGRKVDSPVVMRPSATPLSVTNTKAAFLSTTRTLTGKSLNLETWKLMRYAGG